MPESEGSERGMNPARGGEASPTRRSDRESAWAELICGIAAGNEQSLARLYDESGSVLYSLAYRMLGNAADAEEVVFDVFSQIWRCAKTWDPLRGSSYGWLVMQCRSRCIDKIRSRQTRTAAETSFGSEACEKLCSGKPSGPAEEITIHHALQRLAPGERELLELAFFCGLTHSELSSRMQLPLGTVKGRIRKAVANLRDLVRGSIT